jgi:putative hydrolase of HD superfamily
MRTIDLPVTPARRENVSEHSFSLAVVACALAARVRGDLEIGLVAQYALVHDLVERYAGDTSVWADQRTLSEKDEREARARAQLRTDFGQDFPWLHEMVEAYERREDLESKFVYALDKALPHVSILVAGKHPMHPTYEDYRARIHVALDKIGSDEPEIAHIFIELLEMFDDRQDFFRTEVPSHGRVSQVAKAERQSSTSGTQVPWDRRRDGRA